MRTRQTKVDYAHFLKKVAQHYPNAIKIRLVQDNLNTHNPSAFYQTFDPSQALEFDSTVWNELLPPKERRGWIWSRLSCPCFQNSVFHAVSVNCRSCNNKSALGSKNGIESKSVSSGSLLSITHGKDSNDFIVTHNHNLSDGVLVNFPFFTIKKGKLKSPPVCYYRWTWQPHLKLEDNPYDNRFRWPVSMDLRHCWWHADKTCTITPAPRSLSRL